jgi:hypothetical protein
VAAPVPGPVAIGVSASRISPVGAPSSTACVRVLVNMGFCQVANDREKSVAATACRDGSALVRWIGGSVAHSRGPAAAWATAGGGAETGDADADGGSGG